MGISDMMARRRHAADAFAGLPPVFAAAGRFGDIEVPAARAIAAGDMVPVASAVCRLLARDAPEQPGAALVTGLAAAGGTDIAVLRALHCRLFTVVWDRFRLESGLAGHYASKTKVLSDGCIPEADYGSRWTFKPLHADHSAVLFSHMYGPNAGFSGGEVLLADARAFLAARGFSFDVAFEWSGEAGGSKPVLRDTFEPDIMAKWGRNLGQLTPDSVLFVNNQPNSGVLHGAAPVRVLDQNAFVRQYHRCSVSKRELPVVTLCCVG